MAQTLGGTADSIQVRIDGKLVTVYEDYAVKASVLQQPSAFTLRLGWSDVARELLGRAAPGLPFELRVANVVIQTGRIDGRRLHSDASGTFVEVKGRDAMAPIFDGYVEKERSFAQDTYYEMTRKVLDLVGLEERGLIGSNLANQKAAAGFATARTSKVTNDIQIGTAGSTKAISKALKAKLGERWFDWLQRQYKLAGLFLWCTGEGNFVLAEPLWEQDVAFTILKQRGIDAEFATVLSTDWNDDTTHRHSEIVVHGRGGGGAVGRNKVSGSYTDQEMVDRKLIKRLTVHDEDCKTKAQCEFTARRMSAEERRAGWTLQYTVSGHTAPSLKGSGDAIWGPDLMCRVSDDEIPIEGVFYIEAVEFSRKPDTTTTFTLMRPGDLVFAEANVTAPPLQRAPKG